VYGVQTLTLCPPLSSAPALPSRAAAGRGSRFAHAPEGPAEGATGIGQYRRPLLQIVVLFASDSRVLSYSRNLVARVLDAGIDVFLHTDLPEVGLGDAAAAAGGMMQHIKPEHLSTIISASHADFLIVIGDRNMRNDSVQASSGRGDAARAVTAARRAYARDRRDADSNLLLPCSLSPHHYRTHRHANPASS